MQQSPYSGFSLLRPSTGSSSSNNVSSTSAASKVARMNFAHCNTDWMPSLANSATAGVYRPVVPIDCVSAPHATSPNPNTPSPVPVDAGETTAPTNIFRAFFDRQNFYRGAPLLAVASAAQKLSTATTNNNNNNNTAASSFKAVPNANPTVSVEAPLRTTETTKTRPVIPIPLGSDTWSAFSDPTHTTRSTVLARPRALLRPVAPMAIDAMTSPESSAALRHTPEPLFRDLLALDAAPYTPYTHRSRSGPRHPPKRRDESAPTEASPMRHRLVPPEPISAGALRLHEEHPRHGPCEEEERHQMVLMQEQVWRQHEEGKAWEESQEVILRQQKGREEAKAPKSDSPLLLGEEGQFLTRALLDEVNAVEPPTPNSPTQKTKCDVPLLFGHTYQRSSSLLRKGEENLDLFSGVEEEEDGLERLKRIVNIVLSASSADASNKVNKERGFEMEWAKSEQSDSSFFDCM